MKSITLLLFSLLLILLASCQKEINYENATTFTIEDFGPNIALQGETVEFDHPLLMPRRLLLTDSMLLVENRHTKLLLHKYNLTSRKKTGECIPFGSGPNELTLFKHMQQDDSSIYISDGQLRTVLVYDKDNLCYDSLPIPRQSVTIDDAISSVQHIPNGYVATTMNPFNQRLLFFNANGTVEETKGDYPVLAETMSGVEKVEGFLAEVVYSPASRQIFLFYQQTDLVEIYDLTGNLIKRMHGPDQFFPHVKEKSLGDGYSKVSPIHEKSKEGYFIPLAVGDEIYVAYSGALRENKRPDLTTLLVFSAEGKPLRKYELSEPILTFVVDPQTKDIYATSDNPEYHLIKFSTR